MKGNVNFLDLDIESISSLSGLIQEFEYRKSGVLTFFEHTCAKKNLPIRQQIVSCLECADEDFDNGSFCGPNAKRGFEAIKNKGINSAWAQNLKYAYWFSLPKERSSFQKHLSAGVVAEHPISKNMHLRTDFREYSTHQLGERLISAQNDLLWPSAVKNALFFIAATHIAPTEQVVQVMQNAQNDTVAQNLNTGIQTVKEGLMPYFFRPEYDEIMAKKSKSISYPTIGAIVQKQKEIEPYLENFAYLFLTQGKYYQELVIRNFLENTRKKEQQMLLPLVYGRERE